MASRFRPERRVPTLTRPRNRPSSAMTAEEVQQSDRSALLRGTACDPVAVQQAFSKRRQLLRYRWRIAACEKQPVINLRLRFHTSWREGRDHCAGSFVPWAEHGSILCCL